jgi:hypothetical protein
MFLIILFFRFKNKKKKADMAPPVPVILGENQVSPVVPAPEVQQQQVLMVSNREEDSMNKEPSMSGQQIVGLIIPPPDIRSKILTSPLEGRDNRIFSPIPNFSNRR